jgi:RNA polymerase sigma-70 factor (ECF subfamily)
MASAVGVLANERRHIAAAKVEPAAFAVLYDYYFRPVYNYVYYRVTDRQQADDLVAQIFERVLATLHTYDEEQASFAVWLFTIARNVVTDWLRRKRRVAWSLEQVADHASAAPGPDAQLLTDELHQALDRALAKLADRERDLLALKFVAHLTNRRIAELTGLSESNVGVTLYRALQKLRVELTPMTDSA